MACIFIGLVAMIRSLVQRRKKNQIVPGSTAVDKAPGEHDSKDRGDARVGGHSRILWILFIALKHIFQRISDKYTNVTPSCFSKNMKIYNFRYMIQEKLR